MYFKLNPDYAFRGWTGLPYALRAMKGEAAFQRPRFFDKRRFMLLLRCNGVEDVDLEAADDFERRFYAEIQDAGWVAASPEPMGSLGSYQRYHLYPGAYLESVHWSITGKCNYRCRHCLVSAPARKHGEPSFQQLELTARQLADIGVRSVDITGGEPLIRPDFMELAALLSNLGIRIRTLFTNTAFLSPELLDGLAELGQRPGFQISYDGYGCHDWLRGVPGAESQAQAACRLLGQRGLPYAVSMCVHRGNRDAIRPLWRFLAQNGCGMMSVNAPQSLGEWSQYAEEYALSAAEIWQTYAQAIQDWFQDGMPVGLLLDGYFLGDKNSLDYKIPYVKHLDERTDLALLPYCESLRHGVYISPEGQIMPCMGFADSVLADRFPNIFTGERTLGQLCAAKEGLFQQIRCSTVAQMAACTEENPECASCEYLRQCLGGCMVEGCGDRGQYLHRDERICGFFKNVGEKSVRTVADAAIATLRETEG